MRKVRKVRILSPNGTIISQISQNSHNSYLINENDYFSMQNLHETVEIVETVGRPQIEGIKRKCLKSLKNLNAKTI